MTEEERIADIEQYAKECLQKLPVQTITVTWSGSREYEIENATYEEAKEIARELFNEDLRGELAGDTSIEEIA